MEKDLIVIIPAFNEAAAIGGFLDSLHAEGVFDKADVLVINDGSTDATSFIAKEKGADVVTHVYNLGYGSALQTGYKYAVRGGYQYLIQIDGDGQHDAKNIDIIYKALKAEGDKHPIIIGSRFVQSSETFEVSAIKRFAIAFFRFLIRASTKSPILDPTSGLQGLTRDAFLFCSYYDNFAPDYPDANIVVHLLLNGFRIKEVRSIMHARTEGESMHSGLKPILYIFKMALNTTVVIAREKIFKKKKKK
ncbi:glycosyl transferase family 2 [Clostridia bacterium]|nr:glycosyl transferase family 2 [Clostridia bacterium]